ncbi:MAG: hypothetical protein Q7J98_04190 [Kiritimatiellia bacterium]|nr:hypothetical protein [Kiritimatiellia bacterium]
MTSMTGKSVLIFLVLAVLFASGLAVRRAVLTAQYERYGRPLPFDLESALNFRDVRLLVTTGVLPVIDRYVQYPGGVVVRQTYEIGAEYICAVLARFFPAAVPLAERVRWISAVWFCLGIPAIFFWIWWWQRSVWGAALGGAFYALPLAGVIRSTGQELSHENFALPLLITYWAIATLTERENMRFWTFVCLNAVSAAFLACALMLWDLIQFYVIIWALLGFIRVVRGDYFRASRHRLKWCFVLAALILAGLLNPYLYAHGFAWSPAMLLAYGTLLAMPVAAGEEAAYGGNIQKYRRTVLLRIGLVLLPVIIGFFLCRQYPQSYHHFAELIYAKIIFYNTKPADPSLLTFAQRILWVPALNSASFSLTKTLFPFTLPLFLVSAIIFLFNPHWRTDPEIIGLLFFSFVSLMAFILFVRMHVFAAIGFAASIGLLGAWGLRQRNTLLRSLIAFLLLAGAVAEGANVLRNPVRWGSGQPYLKQRLELVDWLKANAPGQAVLANFGISAFVLAYADCPIILHPKFESPDIRKRTQEYGEMLFKTDEGRFRLWADRFGAAFYIHSLGEFARVCPEAQMRYFVDALNPPPAAPARLFEFKPLASRWFVLLFQNSKYRVFRIITPADEQIAGTKAEKAQREIAEGLLSRAKIEAEHALLYDPGNKNVWEVILQIDALSKK